MKHGWTVAAIAMLLVASRSVAAQDPGLKHIAARTELHPIQTLTLSDEQFLKGDSGGKQVTVSAQFRIAQGSGRLPVVVMVHGSGGIGPNIDVWSKEFIEMAVSTFVLDGFTGRGLSRVSNDQALLGRLNLILDVYRALDVLAKHPRVDSVRIVLMGFSRGGQAALYASMKRFHQTWNKSGVEFAAYIPFYPDCMTTFVSDAEVADRPIRIFHGAPDDYNPVGPCKAYVERLRSAGRDVQLTEYPNAPHGFDNPLGSVTPSVSKDSQTVRRCRIREEPVGQLINTATKQVFTYKDPCVERDPHVGHDPAAAQAAKQSVKNLLRTVLKLD